MEGGNVGFFTNITGYGMRNGEPISAIFDRKTA